MGHRRLVVLWLYWLHLTSPNYSLEGVVSDTREIYFIISYHIRSDLVLTIIVAVSMYVKVHIVYFLFRANYYLGLYSKQADCEERRIN